MQEDLLEKAHLHLRKWFARRMPAHMVFHDLEHTLGVARAAVGIAQGLKLSREDTALVELAALFHDTGYAIDHAAHEEASAKIAEVFLAKFHVSKRQVQRVRGLILSTRIGAVPRSTLQMVLRDADSSKAGQADFHVKSDLLRREMEVLRGMSIDPHAWNEENLKYLHGHQFHTAFAQRRYGTQKRLNLKALKERAAIPQRKLKPVLAKERFMDRDMSWLSFNERVLQEAHSPEVPLLERLKFLAIYSNNLDEFYRVRVASLRSLEKLDRKARLAMKVPPHELVARLNRKALLQQQRFGTLYRETLLPALAKEGIRILNDTELDNVQRKVVMEHFKQQVAPLLNTAAVRVGNAPFIEDRKLYFVCRLKKSVLSRSRLVLLNIPTEGAGRFLSLPSKHGNTDVLFLDDVIRVCLPQFFKGQKVLSCHSIKLSRDAELYLDDEFEGNVKEKVRKSLKKRQTGVPSRFLYDNAMPTGTLKALCVLLNLGKQDLVAGGRYHNFSDLMKLPITGYDHLRDKPWPAIKHPAFIGRSDPFSTIAKADRLLHFPYHDFGALVSWLEHAAVDKAVKHVAITLYRVADGSAVCHALLKALENGKNVTVFVEVQARFDETSNLYWGDRLEKAGANVLYSYERLKVHCKLCLVERFERGRIKGYAYLGTGNFNERTSRLYVDAALLTARPAIISEVQAVFEHLRDRKQRPPQDHLLMAPLTLRTRLEEMIDKEIELALSGRPATILLKLNSIEDRTMIRKLYDASNAGVKVRIIVRGICCLVPGVKGMSENIQAISIVDRYLEHTRAYVFGNNGKTLVYLSSADLMGRNLDRRIEVAFPLLDKALKQELLDLLEIQWSDRVKARWIDKQQTNPYRLPAECEAPVHAQEVTYEFLKITALRSDVPE